MNSVCGRDTNCMMIQESHGSKATGLHIQYNTSKCRICENWFRISVTSHEPGTFTEVRSHFLLYQVHKDCDVSGDHCLFAGCGSGCMKNQQLEYVVCAVVKQFTTKFIYSHKPAACSDNKYLICCKLFKEFQKGK